MTNSQKRRFLRTFREALAEYMRSEGCNCCSDYLQHRKDKERLGKLLRVPKYKDGSGYDFSRYLKEPRQ